ncbi:MAG: PD-(D/E)XK nuclease family protein [Prevotella sp.]|nr:PD-(D/E)XK nuclease family protein [Prevotella sp.]
MTIYFSPEYSGQVYIKPNVGNVMMDTVVVNTIGLINMLELRLGLHYNEITSQRRMVLYYEAMNQYIKANPGNIMAASFKASGLSTAKALLAWRDELRMAQWNFEGKEISRRLKTIIEIEDIFSIKCGYDLAERIRIVKDKIEFEKLDCKDMTIVIPFDITCFKPIIKEMIEILKDKGANVRQLQVADDTGNNLTKIRKMFLEKGKEKITLNPNDESFLIYNFPDEHAADEFFAVTGDDMANVWINENNKQMDNWLSLMNKPLTGSVVDNCSPQVTQLFITGICLFESPLNVKTLIEWLNIPIHPIDSYTRMMLAEKIMYEGGYRNNKCQEIINRYISGDYVYLNEEQQNLSENEQISIRDKDTEKRKYLADVFLPPMEIESSDNIKVQKLMNFVKELGSWSRQMAMLFSIKNKNSSLVEQFHCVTVMCDTLITLLETILTDKIDYHTIELWINTIYRGNMFSHAFSQAYCRCVVSAPNKIISNPDRTIWLEFEGEEAHNMECSFLNPIEQEILTDNGWIKPWNDSDEHRYNELNLLLPFILTKRQLILVVCNRRMGEETEKHPLMVQLEQQIENLGNITRHPNLEMSHLMKVEPVNNSKGLPEIQFNNAEKIIWPKHLSPTNMETLVAYPLDFLMQYLLHIEPGLYYQMADVKTTMGNVAHKIIEKLFAPRNGKRTSESEEIAARIRNEYETVFDKTIEEKGAILLLSENKLKEKLLQEQLRSCLDVLLKIINENNLKVTGCEKYVETDMKFGLAPEKNTDMLGFIDMTLEDEIGNPVVLDFKWTSFPIYFQDLIKENRSVQLEFYRHLLSVTNKKEVKRVAYFLMPMAQLFSKEKFNGSNCTQLTPKNENDIVTQLTNSVRYRKWKIDNGMVETNGSFDELQYVVDTNENNLFPLKKDEKENIKKENIFSNYRIFNN